MRSVVLNGARAVLFAGPAVLAFFSGGYFAAPQLWAGLVTWALVAVCALAGAPLLPRSRGARLTLSGLALLAVWTLISFTWAPLAGSAYHAGQRVVLYAGALLAAATLLRSRGALRLAVPAFGATALIVVAYGISERLLPGLLHFQRSVSAQGRLEQPLTYWNAMGELAAIGFVLCVALAGDATRPRGWRAGGAAGAAPLGMGLYLAFSRGALFACAAGLVALVVAAPRREQLRAGLIALTTGVLAALSAAPFGGVSSLTGTLSTREGQGAIVLLLLTVIMLGAGLAQWRLAGGEATGELRLPRRAPLIALVVICAGLALAIAIGAKENSSRPLSAGATRYVTLQSNRYAYWRVALRAFGDQPLRGVGAGGWAVYWLRYRPIDEFAQDAHSLLLQTLAELGVVGVVLLLTFLGGIAWAAIVARRLDPVLAAGPMAGVVAYVAHAPLDWDWQMPALTLVALGLAGALLALAESAPVAQSSSAIRGASRRNTLTATTQTTT